MDSLNTYEHKKFKLSTLKKIYKKLKTNDIKNNFEFAGNLTACLKSTAVQSFDDNDSEVIQRISYALRCLTLSSINLGNDFYFDFLASLSDIIDTLIPRLITSSAYKNLEKYIKVSPNNQNKLFLINSLMICLAESKVNFTIFDNFPPHEWRQELLIYSLFNACDTDVNVVQNILKKINEISLKIDSRNSLENVLEILLCNSKDSEFNVWFLNDFFFVMCRELDVKNFIFDKSFSEIQRKIKMMKIYMLSTHYSFFRDPAHLSYKNLELNYFSRYTFDVLTILMAKESDDFQNLIKFRQLFECSKMDLKEQILLLLRLDPKESLNTWKYEVAFEIIKDIISVMFPAYAIYSPQKNKTNRIVSTISTPKASCTCYKSECKLHHSTEYCDLLYALNSSFARVIFNCSELSDQIFALISSIMSELMTAEKIIQLINALDILEDYEIEFTITQLDTLLSLLCTDNVEDEVHKYVVKKSFPGTYEKTVDQLLDEIEELYPGITISAVEMFDNVQHCYKQTSSLFPDKDPIKNWDKKQIKMWAETIRFRKLKVSDEEILAVIKRTATVTTKLELRHIQLISVIIMIKSSLGKGRLCQVNTGEGKTVIIAILAAYKAFKGHAVDVYTSSSLLAIPQCKEYEAFYTVLNVSVTHNVDCNSNYNSDVIYGTNNSFQRDVLLDEFRMNGVRKGRKFDIAIVDEVDNMLIDGKNWKLLLSCDMPAMDYLEVLLAAIYIQVNEAAATLIEKDGRTYYLVQETAIDNNGNVKPEISVEEVEIEGSKRDFIINCTETHLRKLIRDVDYCKEIEEGYPEIKIPNHLRDVICKVQLKKWISNAVNAIFLYVKDEDYILKNGKVTIVDADNTGVIKMNSNWSGGLHQFLEIKHGARIHPESFTTNFISNIGLFNRYVSRLYGLTGTLGNEDTKSFLQTTYNVDTVVIPPFKLKQHKHLKPILASNTADKHLETALSCIRKLKHGQAALVIMKYIRETEELADVFIKQCDYEHSKVKLVKTDEDSIVFKTPLQSGEVIITTNIAGRGTDINLTKAVEENGGLHVCLTFLPLNSRVELQNIGRTSRKGNRGTSQFVINDSLCFGDINILKQKRKAQEAKAMAQASETVKRVKISDEIFRKFCRLLDDITGHDSDTKQTNRTAAEERFAIWLVINEDNLDGKCDDVNRRFNVFKEDILDNNSNNTLVQNPCMHINLGNRYLFKKLYDKAISEYDRAIILDHNFSEYAYYNRARTYLAKYGGNLKKHEHFINQAIRDLLKARKLIEDKEYYLHLLQTASKGEVFSEQVSHKLNLYNLIKNTIDLAIGPDIDTINEQIKRAEEDQNNVDLPVDVKNKINENLKNLKECKKEIGTIGRAKYNNRNIEVHSLENDFMPISEQETHKQELQELKRNGWGEGFKVTEIKPIDWVTTISLLGIGLGQLLIGGALTVFTLGAGASIGIGLISEGVSDIITAVKDCIINRNFDWATWALMKVISVAVSVVCAGFKAIKDAAKTAYTGAKTVVSSATKSLTQTTKEGWKLVAKKIGFDMAKGVAKEIVTNLVAYGIDKMVLPMIEEIVIEQVKAPIQQALLNNTKVATMLKLDLESGNQTYENKIRYIAQKILTPEEYSKLKTIAITIATRVADNKGLALTRQVCTGLVGVYELTTYTTTFTNKLIQEINNLTVDVNVNKNDVGQTDWTQSDEIMHEMQNVNHANNADEDINLSKVRQSDEQVKLNKKPRTTDSLSSEIAGMVSKDMIQILKGKIVMPIVQTGANYSIDTISSKVNGYLEKEMENYRSKKNIIHDQNKAYKNNTKDSQKIFSKKEMKKVDLIIDELKNGGPGGLVHLGAISATIDRPIEVYDEKGRLKYTIGDFKKSKPIQIQYHTPEEQTGVGHFTLKDQREPFQKSKLDNMCLFNVVAEQTGHNPNDLKNKTLNIMENNKNTIAKQVKHINRLEMYDKSSLIEGGAQYNGKCPDHAKQFLRNSYGVKGFTNEFVGHADKHIPFKAETIDMLNALSEESGRQIEVYDKNGKLSYIVGEKSDKCPIKVQYNKMKGDTSLEYFSSLGGNEKYNLHDPNDMSFYNIVSKQTGRDASSLKTATLKRIQIPSSKTCLENASKKGKVTGFISEDEQAYVFHYAMQTEVAKQAMNELNEYKPGVNESTEYTRKEVVLTAKELKLPREAYGGTWRKGKLKISWPVTDILLVFQHYKGHADNPKARVHIQTFYPYPPKPSAS